MSLNAKLMFDQVRTVESFRILSIFQKEEVVKTDVPMKDTSVEVAERAVNRLKAKLSFMSRNFSCLEDKKRIEAAAFILGTSRITKKFRCKYLDLTPASNFSRKRTPSITFGLKEYLKCSVTSKAHNHLTFLSRKKRLVLTGSVKVF